MSLSASLKLIISYLFSIREGVIEAIREGMVVTVLELAFYVTWSRGHVH
jgi:hypothetical protein